MKTTLILIFCLIVIVCFSCKTEEIILHGEISGIVTDASTNQPLQAASVILNPVNDTTSTGSDGKYLFKSLTPGDYKIKASKQNYAEGTKPVNVTSANTSEINLALEEIPVIHYSTTTHDFGFYLTSFSFTISKTGYGEVAYLIMPSQNWITVNPRSGDVDNETDSINITINRTGLTQPVYNEWIVINSNYQQYDFKDTIDVSVRVHKIIFNPYKTYGTVTDIEGNVYKTIEIGTQTWMAENLKTTMFNDYKPIPEVTDNTAWNNLKTPGYCWYNNDSTTYRAVSGAMYNGYTVMAGKICPAGWHLPSYDELNTLVTFIGGNAGGGKRLKEEGTTHWTDNTEATNEYGFTAVPSGLRLHFSNFVYIGKAVEWWTSTEYDATQIWEYGISGEDIFPYKSSKVDGYSIRCVKDPPKNK